MTKIWQGWGIPKGGMSRGVLLRDVWVVLWFLGHFVVLGMLEGVHNNPCWCSTWMFGNHVRSALKEWGETYDCQRRYCWVPSLWCTWTCPCHYWGKAYQQSLPMEVYILIECCNPSAYKDHRCCIVIAEEQTGLVLHYCCLWVCCLYWLLPSLWNPWYPVLAPRYPGDTEAHPCCSGWNWCLPLCIPTTLLNMVA